MMFALSPSRSSLLLLVWSSFLAAEGNLRSTWRKAIKDQLPTDDERLDLSDCIDTTATFPMAPDGGKEVDCTWLADNMQEYSHLCQRFAISSLCRRTCGVCLDTIHAVEMVKTCTNGMGTVEYGQEQVTCQWIKEHRAENPEACETTSVALFCPVVCNFWDLPSCTTIDPESTTGIHQTDVTLDSA